MLPATALSQSNASKPYITLSLNLSTVTPSFTSDMPPQITLALTLHNSPHPITIRERETCVLMYPLSTVLSDRITGKVRRPNCPSLCFSQHNLRLCRGNKDGFLTLYPEHQYRRTRSFRPEGAKPGDCIGSFADPQKFPESVTGDTLKAAIEGDEEAAELLILSARASLSPSGIDRCVVGREYVLKIKEGLRIHWWRYGEIENLLSIVEEREKGRHEGRRRKEWLGSEEGDLDLIVENGMGDVIFTVIE